MKLAVIRLVLALVLFAGWIGYLGYQVWTRPRTKKDDITSPPLVLSRPQILASEIDIIGDVPAASNKVTVTVVEVLYPPNDPSDGRINTTGALYRWPMLVGALGLLPLICCAVIVCQLPERKKPAAKPAGVWEGSTG